MGEKPSRSPDRAAMSEKSSLADKPDEGAAAELPPSLRPAYEDSASLLSLWTLSWVWRLSGIARRRRLVESDMVDVGIGNGCEAMADRLEHLLERYETEDAEHNASLAAPTVWRRFVWRSLHRLGLRQLDGRRQRGVAWATARLFFPRLALSGVPFVLAKLANISIPVLVRVRASVSAELTPQFVILFISATQAGSNPAIWRGLLPAILLPIAFALVNIVSQLDYKHSTRMAGIGRGALSKLALRRATDLSPAARLQWPDAKIVSLLVGDVNRMALALTEATSLLPFADVIGIVTLLLVFLGVPALPGIAVITLLVPMQRWFVLRIYRYRALATAQADRRMALTHEVVGSLSAIKLQSWQGPLAARIQAVREISMLKRTKLLNAGDQLIYAAAPLTALLVAYSTFAFTTDRVAAPATIFSSFLLFVQLQQPFLEISRGSKAFVDAAHGFGRLDSLLRAGRRRTYLQSADEKLALSVHASFVWPTVEDAHEKPRYELHLDLDVEPGELVAVVGAVKTGKSAICAALTDSMTLSSGTRVAINGSVVSVSQHAYIIAGASARDQIVFDLPLDRALLDNVLHSTCLDIDLQTFEHGEQTVRRAACCCYSRRPAYLRH